MKQKSGRVAHHTSDPNFPNYGDHREDQWPLVTESRKPRLDVDQADVALLMVGICTLLKQEIGRKLIIHFLSVKLTWRHIPHECGRQRAQSVFGLYRQR